MVLYSEKAECESCENTSCLIKKHALSKELSAYINKKNTIRVKKSQQFIIEGAPVQGLFFVYKGKVKVKKTGINGREQIVRFSTNGEIIGHRGFGVGNYYQISAEAVEDTVMCNFSNDIIHEMLTEIPKLTYDMMLFYAEELNISETKVRKIAQMSVRERVIDTLLYILRKFGQEQDYFGIVLPRKDIADFAGTTDEQVIRNLSSLKKEGLIRAQGKRLGIIDLDRLKQEISEHNYFLDS